MKLGSLVCSFSLGLALAAGCRAPSADAGACVMDAQCQQDGVIGRCEVDTGLCVLPNADCDSGWSYQASGKCAPPETEEAGDESNDNESESTESDEGGTDTGDGSIIDDFSGLGDMGEACGQEIGSCDKLDVLFVIDNTASIGEDIDSLIALANPDLLGQFTDGPCDVQLGVTFLDPQASWQPAECRFEGALASSGMGANGEPCYGEGHPPYFTTGDDIGGLFCALSGQTQDASIGNERHAATIEAALGEAINAEGACNDGFLRPDAANLIIVLTDEDDDDDTGKPGESPGRTGSPGTPAEWASAIAERVTAQRTGILVVAPLADTACTWQPLAGNQDGIGGEIPENLLLASNIFGNSNGYPDHTTALELCQDASELAQQLLDEAADLVSVVCEDSGL